MTIRHLDDLFEPASVAVIGASTRPGTVGATVWRNLRRASFAGPRWAVNLHHKAVDGEPAFAKVQDLPATPELAVVCTPPDTVPGLIAELGAKGTRAAIVLTAGFTPAQKQAMLDAARCHLVRILGPNCMGLLSPPVGLNASFTHTDVGAGELAFVSQSGALMSAMLDWARGRGIGFSRAISLGEQADVDFGDMLDWLGSDAQTRAILLYVESLVEARKFMSAARAAARNKPVLLVKAGRSAPGRRATAAHLGAWGGHDQVIDAAVRRAGMLRVDSLQDLAFAAETLAYLGLLARAADPEALKRFTVVTNGGGAGVLAADAAAHHGLELASLAEPTLAALETGLPPNWSRGNPVDLIGDAPVERYVHTLSTLLAAPEAGMVLFMHAPTAIVPAAEIARALVPLAQRHAGRVLSCWLGEQAVAEARALFHGAGVPTYETPELAVQALAMLATYRRNQELLLEAPPAHAASGAAAPFDRDAVRRFVDGALASGHEWLGEPEAKALLAACGIPVVPTRVVAATPEAAAAAASTLGFPVVLEILAPQIEHRGAVGGIAFDLDNAAMVSAAAAAMLERVARLRPGAAIEGLVLEPMVRRPGALELFVGARIDPLFGPVIEFGAGGHAAAVDADRSVALPPLNPPLARALVARTRVARRLTGWHGVPPADEGAIHGVLIAVSQLLAEEPRIAALEIDPLLADAEGVVALGARVRVSAAAPAGAAHFAIRPYPAELVESFLWTLDGRTHTVTLRPIRPEDEVQHLSFLLRLDPEDIRMRLFYSRRRIERSELARLTQIDYEREMAFIATWHPDDAHATQETLGVVRVIADPDNVEAEFGILVRSDLKEAGLGRRLMDKMIAFLRQRGTKRLMATVLLENHRMLALAESLGLRPSAEQPDAQSRHFEMSLEPVPAPTPASAPVPAPAPLLLPPPPAPTPEG